MQIWEEMRVLHQVPESRDSRSPLEVPLRDREGVASWSRLIEFVHWWVTDQCSMKDPELKEEITTEHSRGKIHDYIDCITRNQTFIPVGHGGLSGSSGLA